MPSRTNNWKRDLKNTFKKIGVSQRIVVKQKGHTREDVVASLFVVLNLFVEIAKEVIEIVW